LQLKIAVAQISIATKISQTVGQKRKIRNRIEEAGKKGVKVICFPEGIAVAGFYDHTNMILREFGPTCKEYGIYAIIGTITTKDSKVYNSAVVVDSNGQHAGTYYKQYLLGGEKDQGITAGRHPLILDTEFGRIGIIICNDMRSLEVLVQYYNKDIQVLFCPSNMVIPTSSLRTKQRHLINKTLQAIAFQQNCIMVTAMAYGKDIISHSSIISPLRILRTIKDREGLLVWSVDLEKRLKVLPLLDLRQDEVEAYINNHPHVFIRKPKE
jgi:nitrilase